MKITPVAAPAAIAQSAPNTNSRAKAIEAFTRSQAANDKPSAPIPVDPSNVSVEELSAITKNEPEIVEEAVTEPQVEAEAVKEEAKPDPVLSRQFAQLARQEKALRIKAQQQDQAIKAREAAVAAKEAELLKPSQPSFDASKYISKDEFLANPLKVMAETGMSYDTLTQQILNTQPTDPRTEAVISKLEAKIKALEEGAENTQKSYKEQQDQAYKAAVRQIEVDTRNLVKNDPNFETIKATGSIPDVVELITETFNKDGVLLSVEEAAQQVEDYLIEEAMKVTRIGKIKSRLEQAAQPAKVQPKTAQPQQPQTMKTLTNAASGSRKLSTRERAILAFKNELKS